MRRRKKSSTGRWRLCQLYPGKLPCVNASLMSRVEKFSLHISGFSCTSSNLYICICLSVCMSGNLSGKSAGNDDLISKNQNGPILLPGLVSFIFQIFCFFFRSFVFQIFCFSDLLFFRSFVILSFFFCYFHLFQ